MTPLEEAWAAGFDDSQKIVAGRRDRLSAGSTTMTARSSAVEFRRREWWKSFLRLGALHPDTRRLRMMYVDAMNAECRSRKGKLPATGKRLVAMRELLCFGGPLNEQIVMVNEDAPVIYGAMPDRPIRFDEDPTEVGPSPRKVTYTLEKVGFHDWTGLCLIAEGYPKHRITDALNAIVGMTTLLSSGSPQR